MTPEEARLLRFASRGAGGGTTQEAIEKRKRELEAEMKRKKWKEEEAKKLAESERLKAEQLAKLHATKPPE